MIQPSNPNILYAGAVGEGMWKSTNGGVSWRPLTDFLTNIAVSSIAMDPSNPSVQ